MKKKKDFESVQMFNKYPKNIKKKCGGKNPKPEPPKQIKTPFQTLPPDFRGPVVPHFLLEWNLLFP